MIGLGYLMSDAVTATAVRLGVRLIVFFLAAFALYLLFHRARRRRVIRLFRRGRMTPDELSAPLGQRGSMAMFDPPSTEGSEVGVHRGKDRSMELSRGTGRLAGRDLP